MKDDGEKSVRRSAHQFDSPKEGHSRDYFVTGYLLDFIFCLTLCIIDGKCHQKVLE